MKMLELRNLRSISKLNLEFCVLVFFSSSVGHWLILAYGIMSLTMGNLLLLFMVPLPALFYIFTVKFTDPSEFRDRDERNH